MNTAPVGRFAPTPSGRMHLGNVFAALIAWLSVKSRGGTMVLRMEDLDTQRTREEYAAVLRQDLLWLGLDWDVETPPQSKRGPVYDRYFEQLQALRLLYPCYCTRSQLHNVNAPHLSDGTYVYAGTCRNLTEAERSAFGRAPPGGSGFRTRPGRWMIKFRADTRKTFLPIAAILWCAVPMGYMCTSWLSPWMTGKPVLPRWCGVGIFSALLPGRCICRRCSAFLTRNTAMCQCSLPLTDGA